MNLKSVHPCARTRVFSSVLDSKWMEYAWWYGTGTVEWSGNMTVHPSPSQVMKVLQKLIPESVCPYSLLLSHRLPSSQMITTLAFKGSDILISGCRDCHVSPQTALLHCVLLEVLHSDCCITCNSAVEILKIKLILLEGPRTSVDQPKIKYWNCIACTRNIQ